MDEKGVRNKISVAKDIYFQNKQISFFKIIVNCKCYD